MRAVMERLLNWLFPPKCIFCGEFLEAEGDICPKCRESIPKPEEALCRTNMGMVERLYCALYYDGLVPNGIARFKFQQRPKLHKNFADLMMERMGWALIREQCDLVVYVPMHKHRQALRGYNQAQILAKELARQLDVPYSDCLKKVRKSKEQHTLNRTQRRIAQKDSYACQTLHGEKILLVDDVCTSGSTMMECARMLREAGASSVIGAAICLTPNDREQEENQSKKQ